MNRIHPDLIAIHELIYKPCKMHFSQVELGESRYVACTFELDGARVKFRAAKTTPKKTDQFMTFWKRKAMGLFSHLTSKMIFNFHGRCWYRKISGHPVREIVYVRYLSKSQCSHISLIKISRNCWHELSFTYYFFLIAWELVLPAYSQIKLQQAPKSQTHSPTSDSKTQQSYIEWAKDILSTPQ